MKEEKGKIKIPYCCHQDLGCMYQTESMVYNKKKKCKLLVDTEFRKKDGSLYKCPFVK